MQEITETQFAEKVDQAAKPVLVDFSAVWCPPCKMLHPVIERLSLEYADQLDVFSVNIDESPGLGQRFNISGVPTMIFFKEGQEIKKLVGFRDYDTLKGEIDSVL
jgi:thioredoxin 1